MTRVAILGAGAIARIHIAAYKRLEGRCRVVAVVDKFADKAEALIREAGLDARAYADIDEMLAAERPDAVSVCLPPSMHAAFAVKAAEAGAHVLCEKPMASSLEECDAMIAAASKAGVLLSVVCQNRFRTPMARMRRLLESGQAGKLLAADIRSLWWRGDNYYDIWWRGTWEMESGGCFMSHSVHYLDLMAWALGMPDGVEARIMNVAHGNSQCEDHGIALFDYGGTPVSFTSSLVDHGSEQKLHFDCERASWEIPWKASASRALPNGFPEEDARTVEELGKAYESGPAVPVEGHDAQIANFVDAIQGAAPLLTPGEDGRRVVELIMGVYQSSALGRKVLFPLTKDDPVYTKDGLLALMPHFHEKTRSVDNFATDKITFARKM